MICPISRRQISKLLATWKIAVGDKRFYAEHIEEMLVSVIDNYMRMLIVLERNGRWYWFHTFSLKFIVFILLANDDLP